MTVETRDVLAGLVAKGAAWLDEHRGKDWADKIDLDELCMADSCDCVLGQQEKQRTGGDYGDVVDQEDIKPYQMGFNAADKEEFTELEEVWAALIRGRRLEGQREVTS